MQTRHTFMHAFSEYPKDSFASQQPDEQILLSLRAHPATLFMSFVISLLLLVAPVLFAIPLAQAPLSTQQQTFIIIAWYAFTLSYILNKIFVWYFNIGIITDKRIVDIDVYNIMNSVTNATTLGKIEEVEQGSSGFFSAHFNYGNVTVQTAGENPNIEFHNIPQPSLVAQTLNRLMHDHHD